MNEAYILHLWLIFILPIFLWCYETTPSLKISGRQRFYFGKNCPQHLKIKSFIVLLLIKLNSVVLVFAKLLFTLQIIG